MATKINRTPGQTLEHVFGITTRKAVSNILAMWDRANVNDVAAGRIWYREAGQYARDLADAFEVSAAHAATVIAHLSPRASWQANKDYAFAACRGKHSRPTACIGGNWDRAVAALETTLPLVTLRGNKTHAFALNILGDESAVTVDVWALRIALGDKYVRETADGQLARVGAYDAIAHAYRLAAKRAGVSPAVMQATTWCVARGRSD